jgi:hypothetical protein
MKKLPEFLAFNLWLSLDGGNFDIFFVALNAVLV